MKDFNPATYKLTRIDAITHLERKYPYYNGSAINLNTVTDEIMNELDKGTNINDIRLTVSLASKTLSWEVL